jgi:uncharacterized protein YjbJ (UPF0337 family)
MEHNNAEQARAGLVGAIKGKVKEAFGAVTGNDSLTAEGQLDQVEAQKRKEANAAEALADAEAAEAQSQKADARSAGVDARTEVNSAAASTEQLIDGQATAQKRAAEKAAHQQAVTESARAEQDAQRQAATADAQAQLESEKANAKLEAAVLDHQDAALGAVDAKAEAARLRREADDLTNNADLP